MKVAMSWTCSTSDDNRMFTVVWCKHLWEDGRCREREIDVLSQEWKF